ncbi:formate dehydrogenase accessory sulfurtransferase FdhD [Paracrocinitomix mangrovi]|uniref:formate dehydrogenase accessory sulfurtransferase FdhD n=1 Tax=Paracrocinitomix mangrovi TaxID=2862509 RepID=UPI001C8E8512|nr:formate dehydrogenase accessory sulfurtransferase FdhD [Paracrocinitomix mangrovi]UKN02482.1 formate dehydrogenase accessory sulfurtransferase FdhD [Paracrocinitomix mangrovi]
MKDISEYDAYKFEKGSVTKVTDPLSIESPLQISINGESFTVVMQTPGDEQLLATGLLYAENVISDFNQVKCSFKEDDHGFINEVNLTTPTSNLADGYLSSRSLLSVSSCGICGKKEIEELLPKEEKLTSSTTLSFTSLFQMFETMNQHQNAFKITGGCHGIAAFDNEGNLLSIKEDIGRHNALDKVVGDLISKQLIKKATVLTLSGRVSYEMVSKAFRAKIPVIAAVSAPSSLAVDFAKEYGMTLIGFSRNEKGTCYSGINRLDELKK